MALLFIYFLSTNWELKSSKESQTIGFGISKHKSRLFNVEHTCIYIYISLRQIWTTLGEIIPTSLPELPIQLKDLRNNQKSSNTTFYVLYAIQKVLSYSLIFLFLGPKGLYSRFKGQTDGQKAVRKLLEHCQTAVRQLSQKSPQSVPNLSQICPLNSLNNLKGLQKNYLGLAGLV